MHAISAEYNLSTMRCAIFETDLESIYIDCGHSFAGQEFGACIQSSLLELFMQTKTMSKSPVLPRRQLFKVGINDIGLEVAEAERKLAEIFELAEAWNVILLM